MKATINVLSGIIFYCIIPLVGVVYVIHDSFRKNKNPPLEPNRKIYTRLPSDPCENFNEWINYIHDLRNQK